jgi:acetoin utilization protein AcuB
MTPVIDDFMTRRVQTIGMKSRLSEAHRLMNDNAIRHLPVLEGGRLVGMLSQRDLHLIETLQGVDPQEVTVEEAMTQDVYSVPPGTSLVQVARTMAAHKYGSVLVLRGNEVEGIFTTIDALQALATVLKAAPRKAAARKAPVKKAATRKTSPKKAPARKAPARRKAAPARGRGRRS